MSHPEAPPRIPATRHRPPRLRHRWSRVAGALTLGVASLLVGGPGAGAEPASSTIAEGAVSAFDVGVDTEGVPALEVVTEDGAHLPESVTIRVDGEVARTTIPAPVPDFYEGYVTPGATVYETPGTLTAGLPAIGWSTRRIADGVVSIDLRVHGPGDVVVLGADDRGDPLPHVDSRDGVPDVLSAKAGGNGWPTWIFGEPGTYVLDARPRLATEAGEVAGEWTRYRIEVTAPVTDPEPPVADPEPPAVPEPPTTPAEPPAQPVPPPGDGGWTPPSATQDATPACAVEGLDPQATTVADGHFDYGVQVHNGQLVSRIKDDRSAPPVWRAPATLLFALGRPARGRIPDAAAYSFLGNPGDPIWSIAQTQESKVPWLGWNTQHPTAVDRIDGPTTWRLDAVDGPGELFIYQTGSLGGVSKLLGLTADWPRQLRIPPNTHAHANWSFTEPGIYKVRTTHLATLRSGDSVSSTETLFFQVGACTDEDRPTGPVPNRILLDDKQLRSGNRNGIRVTPSTVTPGESVAVAAPGVPAGSWLMPVLYSAPRQLGWQQISATADIPAVRVPADTAGGRHKLAVYDTEGLVGWAPTRVVVEDPPPTADEPPVQRDPGATAAPAAPPPLTPAPSTSACVPSTADPDTDSGDDAAGEDAPGTQTAVSDGHFDFGPEISGSDLVMRVKDDRTQPPTWAAPEAYRFVIGAAAEQKVPAGGAYSFLGQAGDPIWLLPQTQVSGVPWLGWNTQHETVRSEVRGPVRFTLDQVSGPGELAVYLTDSFGGVGERVVGSVRGFPRSFDVPLNVHAHGNWAFTQPGTYQVVMTLSATLANGTRVADQGTLTFAVGGTGASPSRLLSSTRSPSVLLVSSLVAGESPEGAPAASPVVAEETDPPAESAESQEESTCALPETGAGRWTTLLLPLGVAMVATGAGLLLWYRRTAPSLASSRA